MSDFTLPKDDEKRRKEAIFSYRQQIAAATSLAEANENVLMPPEEVIVSARQANRMAFELMMAGVYVESEWRDIIKPFARYLPTRPYERGSNTLQALADQANQMEPISQ